MFASSVDAMCFAHVSVCVLQVRGVGAVGGGRDVATRNGGRTVGPSERKVGGRYK